MLSLEIRFLSVVAPPKKASMNIMVSYYVFFHLRLDFHEGKLLQEISFKALQTPSKGTLFFRLKLNTS